MASKTARKLEHFFQRRHVVAVPEVTGKEPGFPSITFTLTSDEQASAFVAK
jgi:hypothetical protein